MRAARAWLRAHISIRVKAVRETANIGLHQRGLLPVFPNISLNQRNSNEDLKYVSIRFFPVPNVMISATDKNLSAGITCWYKAPNITDLLLDKQIFYWQAYLIIFLFPHVDIWHCVTIKWHCVRYYHGLCHDWLDKNSKASLCLRLFPEFVERLTQLGSHALLVEIILVFLSACV